MHKKSENNIRGPVWYPSCLPDSMPDTKCVGSFAVWRVLFQSFLEYFSKLCLVEATHKHCPLTDCTNLSLSTLYISCDSLQHWGESQSLVHQSQYKILYFCGIILNWEIWRRKKGKTVAGSNIFNYAWYCRKDVCVRIFWSVTCLQSCRLHRVKNIDKMFTSTI